jgi:hypothetical protein
MSPLQRKHYSCPSGTAATAVLALSHLSHTATNLAQKQFNQTKQWYLTGTGSGTGIDSWGSFISHNIQSVKFMREIGYDTAVLYV